MSVFYILLRCERTGEDWVPDFTTTYPDGAAANAVARANNDYWAKYGYPTRMRVRKVVDTDDDNYIAREEAKNHTPLPWTRSDYYGRHFKWQLAHIDPNDKFMIRFFDSIEDAIECKYKSLKVSRFLSRFEDFTDDRMQKILVDMGVYADAEFGVTQDLALVQEVYMNGPASCMNDPDDYPIQTDPHPAAVYSKGDLGVAYIKTGEKDYTARCIVHVENKIYAEGYGHTSLLFERLEEAGYTRSGNYRRDFVGAKIAAIKDNDGEWLMPYVDVANTADLSDDETMFILSDCGDYDIKTTDGCCYYEGSRSDDDYDDGDY